MVAFITLYASAEFLDGQKIHYLSENSFPFVHGTLLSDIEYDPKGVSFRSLDFQIDPI